MSSAAVENPFSPEYVEEIERLIADFQKTRPDTPHDAEMAEEVARLLRGLVRGEFSPDEIDTARRIYNEVFHTNI